jgi:hypothetical protein
VKAGIMLAGDGLRPSKFGKRIHFSGAKRSVTDGPFAETKELVAGFWIWQVRSMDEAVEWAKRCPNPMPGPSDLEIRPFWESEDFGPEIAAQVNALRPLPDPVHQRARSGAVDRFPGGMVTSSACWAQPRSVVTSFHPPPRQPHP